jgi:hypothetical protein
MAKKQPKISEEEQVKQQLEREFNELKSCYINEPTILYSIGQEVNHGCVKQSIVKEVFENGKILLLDQISTDNNYGRPVDSKRQIYVAWHNVSPVLKKKPEQICYSDDVFFQSCQCNLSSILNRYYHFGIDLEPDYQRGNVWTPEDENSLIDSIFNNIKIGQFVYIFRGYEGKVYECLDGKQRTNTLIRFYESRFKYRGLTYAEMCGRDQDHFENFTITILESKNEMTHEQKYRYFLKLNAGGRQQDPAHLAEVKQLWENCKIKRS